ncbi:putative transposase [Rhizobium leguminosarum]|nr:putative transposase [Rhizobium leguminosarum]
MTRRPRRNLLGFSRGSVYYHPRPVCDGDLALMRRIDELHLDYPFAGSRMLQGLLRSEGLETGRLHVATLMKKMGIWFSRRVLSWRLSITMEAAFCIEAVEETLARYGKPEIFNTDQGSQFTSIDFTAVLKKAEIAISMDGKGAWRDNVFVERLWRSIKYEEVYLHAYKTVSEARAGIGRYLNFYNPVS